MSPRPMKNAEYASDAWFLATILAIVGEQSTMGAVSMQLCPLGQRTLQGMQ